MTNEQDQTQLLSALYQEYLTEVIQLKEQNVALRLKVAELEAQLEGGEAEVDSDTND